MSASFDGLQKFGKEQLEAASAVTASLAKGLQAIAAETAEFSKKSVEANSAYVEQLLNAKSIDDTIRIQSEYAKSAYERLLAQITKIGEFYASLAKDAFKPVESALAKFPAAGGKAPVSK